MKNYEKTRYHLLMGHPQASRALLNASTQPHFMQRSYLVPLLSMCGHWRQISSRRLRSLALTRLTPFLSSCPAASSRLLAMVAMVGFSLAVRPGFCGVRLKHNFCGLRSKCVIVLASAANLIFVHGLNVVVNGDRASWQTVGVANRGIATAHLQLAIKNAHTLHVGSG